MYDSPLPIDNLPRPTITSPGVRPSAFEAALLASIQKNKPQQPPARAHRDAAIAAAPAPLPGVQQPPAANPLATPDGMRAQAQGDYAQRERLMQQQMGILNAPPAAPPQYQAPQRKGIDPKAELGVALGTLLFPHAANGFSLTQRQLQGHADQQFADDTARAKATYDAQAEAAQMDQQRRNTDLLRYQQLGRDLDTDAQRLTTSAEHAEHDRATEQAALQKLGIEAQNVALNRDRFDKQFQLGLERLGFAKSKWSEQRTLEAAKQASLDTYRLQSLGVRSDTAFKVAQLRAATQLTQEGMRQGGMDKRSAATNDVRRELAQDRDFQQNAQATLRSIHGYIVGLNAADPKTRAAAIANLNASMDDANSPLHRFMDDMRRRGIMGESVGEELQSEIRAGMPAQTDDQGRPISPVSIYVNGQGASASPNGGNAPAPAASAAPSTSTEVPPYPHQQPHPPTNDEAMAEAKRFAAANHGASAADIKKHLEGWIKERSGPPR